MVCSAWKELLKLYGYWQAGPRRFVRRYVLVERYTATAAVQNNYRQCQKVCTARRITISVRTHRAALLPAVTIKPVDRGAVCAGAQAFPGAGGGGCGLLPC